MRKNKSKIQKPSKEFFKFLETVNLMRGLNLPSYSFLIQHFKLNFFSGMKSDGEANIKAREATEIILLDTIKSHAQFCKYIFGKFPNEAISSDDFGEGLSAYETFRSDRETLLQAIKMLSKNSKKNLRGKTFLGIVPVQTLIQVDSNGHLVKETFGFKNFESLDLRRFKFCPVCEDIFWLSRIDKQACEKCSNAFRQRQYQMRNKEEINERRRIEYAYQKAIEREKNKNGNL